MIVIACVCNHLPGSILNAIEQERWPGLRDEIENGSFLNFQERGGGF